MAKMNNLCNIYPWL